MTSTDDQGRVHVEAINDENNAAVTQCANQDAADDDQHSIASFIGSELAFDAKAPEKEALPIDDKSMIKRAYDLIDSTARRKRRHAASSEEQSESDEDGDEDDNECKTLDEPGPDFDDIEMATNNTEVTAVVTAVLVADDNVSVRSKSSKGTRAQLKSLIPGAEYIRARAPGLSSDFNLEFQRDSMRRTLEERQATRGEQGEVEPDVESPQEVAHNAIPIATALHAFVAPTYEEECAANEEKNRKLLKKRRCVGVILLLFVVGAAAAGFGLAFGTTKKEKSGALSVSVPAPTPTPSPVPVTKFSPFMVGCAALHSEKNPHVLTQCRCNGKISFLAADIVSRYSVLNESFVTTIFPTFKEHLHSCAPENQALVWLASGDGVSADTSTRQRYILALIFIVWSGPQWTSNGNWLLSDSECSWTGVACAENGTIVEIDLHSNGLAGTLGSDFAMLTSLTSLSLDQNSLQGSLPSDLSKLSVLEFLNLENNQLTGSLPSALGVLSHLYELTLGYNKFVGTIPTWIGMLQDLVTLSLSNNIFTLVNVVTNGGASVEVVHQSTIPTEIGLLTRLQSLDLSSTWINGTFPEDLFSLGESLQVLDVSGNFMTGLIPSLFGRLAAIGKFQSVVIAS